MRTIERSGRFRRDFKREAKRPRSEEMQRDLVVLLNTLATDAPLETRYRDHALAGQWNDARDCHLRPDLVLIYRKPDDTTLQLLRLGSHAELFG